MTAAFIRSAAKLARWAQLAAHTLGIGLARRVRDGRVQKFRSKPDADPAKTVGAEAVDDRSRP
jgi:hypothetical protein